MTPNDLYKLFPESSHATKVRNHFQDSVAAKDSGQRVSDKTAVLCFTNRCGSTWIGALLSKFGVFPEKTDSGLNFEFFNADNIIKTSQAKNLKSLPHYVDHLIEGYTSSSGYLSTKLSVDQLAWLSRTGIMKSQLRNPKFIFVRRRNTLAQAISFSIAMQTHQWTSNHTNKVAEAEYKPQEIINLHKIIVTSNAYFECFFNCHGITPIEFIYEDVLGKDDVVLSKIGDALGIKSLSENVATDEKSEGFNVNIQRTSRNAEWEDRLRNDYCQALGLVI